ncbi:hypothetical protein BP6252_13270 [Coleophoma cylindrospora]|uniref:DUF7029 domain-containing protein n=1 Tax=Coleophoma cylindrospora TaxID=1849047 RepID=A0A3D8QBF6_9HELO|nr:hypothetical protein BP6252_13270 [Coleophoma cylindrospora]
MKWPALVLLGASGALAFPQQKQPIRRDTVITLLNNTSIKNSTDLVQPPVLSTITVQGCEATTAALATQVEEEEAGGTTYTTTIAYEFPTASAGPMATLLPVIPTTHDINNIENLTPQGSGNGVSIHYAQESPSDNSQGLYAIVTPSWNSPSVVLDHSAAITNVEVSDQGHLIITFQDRISFDHSSNAWTIENLIFITYTPNCGAYEEGERCYYQASQIVFDPNSLTITVIGQSYNIKSLTININISWGSYGNQPVHYDAGSASPSAASSASPSSTEGSSAEFPLLTPAATATCVAPSDTKFGLPTACLGPAFDDDLDTELGYFDINTFSYGGFADGINLETDSTGTNTPLGKREILDTLKKFTNSTVNAIKDASSTISDKLTEAKNGITKLGSDVVTLGQKLIDGKAALDELALNIAFGKPNTFAYAVKLLLPQPEKECTKDKRNCKPIEPDVKAVKSPWGEDAILLKSFAEAPKTTETITKGKKVTSVVRAKFFNIYCVRCGLEGALRTSGSVTIQGNKGITAGSFIADLDLTVSVGLGVHAENNVEKEFDTKLYDIPISPFTLGFLTVGPFLSIGTTLTLTAKMNGSALARVDAKIPRGRFTYDFAKGEFSQSGFKPAFTPQFKADGDVTLSAQFAVPVGLEFGISAFGGGCALCVGSVGIQARPALKAAAALSAQASYDPKAMKLVAGFKPIDKCTGISTTLTVRNDINSVLKGFGLVNKTKLLHETQDYVLAATCIGNKVETTTTKPKTGPKRREEIEAPSRPAYIARNIFNGSTTSIANSSSNATSNDLVDVTQYVVNELTDIGYQGADLPSIPYSLDDDSFPGYFFTKLSVQGSNGSYVLAACNDNNVYVQPSTAENAEPDFVNCPTLWAGYDDVILSTPTGGVLHYYNNTMSTANVSRLRVADEADLPGTSVLVSLGPFYYTAGDNANTGANILAAIDPDDNLFFPVVCTYTNSSSKIYLVTEDISAGISTLKSSDVVYSITNGQVDECYLLYLEIVDPVLGAFSELEDIDASYASNPLDLEFNSTAFDQNGNLIVLPEDLYSPDVALFDYNDDMVDLPETPIEYPPGSDV